MFYWAKILGAPRENNFGKKQWSIEIEPDDEGRKLIKELGLNKRMKDPREGDQHQATYMSFHQDSVKADGSAADPIRVVKADGQPWAREDGLIGNRSVGDIKFVVKKYGPGKQDGVYIRAVRVLDLVPYVPQEFAPLSEDDQFFSAPEEEFARLPEGMEPTTIEEELDDDLP